MSRIFFVLFFTALLVARAEAEILAYDCRFDWLVNGSVEQENEEWTIDLVDIDHHMRIVIEETEPDTARIITGADAVPAEVVKRQGMVQILEQSDEAVSATTTIFVLRDINGAYPAVHTNQHTHNREFGASQLHGSCTPET